MNILIVKGENYYLRTLVDHEEQWIIFGLPDWTTRPFGYRIPMVLNTVQWHSADWSVEIIVSIFKKILSLSEMLWIDALIVRNRHADFKPGIFVWTWP